MKVCSQVAEDFSGDKSLQTAQDVFLGQTLSSPSIHIFDCSWVVAKPANGNQVESAIGLTIASAVQSHAVGATRRDRTEAF